MLRLFLNRSKLGTYAVRSEDQQKSSLLTLLLKQLPLLKHLHYYNYVSSLHFQKESCGSRSIFVIFIPVLQAPLILVPGTLESLHIFPLNGITIDYTAGTSNILRGQRDGQLTLIEMVDRGQSFMEYVPES